MVVEVAPLRGAEVTVTTADVLHRAADVIEEWGWVQGHHARRADGSACRWDDREADGFCALGAIHRALDDLGVGGTEHDLPWFRRYGVPVRAALGESIHHWNDASERLSSEVVSTLRAAAGGAT